MTRFSSLTPDPEGLDVHRSDLNLSSGVQLFVKRYPVLTHRPLRVENDAPPAHLFQMLSFFEKCMLS